MTKSTPILTGPTAVGKSGIALQIARELKARGRKLILINCDSLIVYRHMDVGTAKPTREELQEIEHRLVDIRNPDETYSAADFLKDVKAAQADAKEKGADTLLVGGTGFYLKALLLGLWDVPAADLALRKALESRDSESLQTELRMHDPISANKIPIADRYRMIRALEIWHQTGKALSMVEESFRAETPKDFRLIILDRPNDELFSRIHARTQTMSAIVDETKYLLKHYPESRALGAVGYAQAVRYLKGEVVEGRVVAKGLEGLFSEIDLATRQLVKKQRTFFNGLAQKVEVKRFELDRDHETLLNHLREHYEIS
jgi:tRNA dimethylallyltransferase